MTEKPLTTFYGHIPLPSDSVPDRVWNERKRKSKRRSAAEFLSTPPIPKATARVALPTEFAEPRAPKPLVFIITLTELFALRDKRLAEEAIQ